MPRINMPGAEKRPEGTPAGAGDFGATRGASAGNVDGAVTPTTEIHDPVRRAEQTIGAFFEDEETPNARFSIDRDRDSGRFVYRLVDSSTGEVVKQFPGDYVLRRVAYYRELEGLAVDNEV
ncbi:flagellar protein FlaG [Sneathiella chinensis]|nr:flagellar protein FlaG [Sneathiella chinensis]